MLRALSFLPLSKKQLSLKREALVFHSNDFGFYSPDLGIVLLFAGSKKIGSEKSEAPNNEEL